MIREFPRQEARNPRSLLLIASLLLSTVFVSALPSDASAWGGNGGFRRAGMGMNAGPGMQRSNWGRGGHPMMMMRGRHGFHGGRAMGIAGAIAFAAMANHAAQAAPTQPMPRGERVILKKSSRSKVAGKPAQDNKTKQLVKRPPLKNLKDLAKKASDETKANCPDCKPVLNSVARLEEGLKQDEARLAALKEYKARHVNELQTMTDPGMRAAHEEVIRNAETGIQETQDLINLATKCSRNSARRPSRGLRHTISSRLSRATVRRRIPSLPMTIFRDGGCPPPGRFRHPRRRPPNRPRLGRKRRAST